MCSVSCTSLRSNCLLADISSLTLTQITLKTRKNTKVIKAEIFGEDFSDDDSGSEDGNEGTFENSRLASCLNTL